MFSIRNFLYNICPRLLKPYWKRVEVSSIGSRLARGVFWSVAGSLLSSGLTLCATVITARILGKSVYGELGMIQSTIGMFGVFAGFGMGLTATKYVAVYRQNDPERAGHIIGLTVLFTMCIGGLMALGVLIFAPWLAVHTINAPHLDGVLRISALILFISAVNGAQTGALAGFEGFKIIASVNLFVGLLSFPILLCGAYFGGLFGAVWALAINLSFNWLINHLALRKEARRHNVPLSFRNCSREWTILWKFSLPAVLAGSMVGPVNWACNAILVNQPDGFEEMGIYSAASGWYALLMFLPRILGRVALPILSDQLSQNNTKQSMTTMLLAIKINLFITTPLIFVVSIASPYIMCLYGEGFGGGWATLIVVVMTTGLIALQTPVGQIIAASGRMWISFTINIGWALTFIVSTLLLVDHGSLGLASARMLGYLTHAMLTLGYVVLLIHYRKKK